MAAVTNLELCLMKKMQESMDNIDRIEKYLKGLLSKEEEQAFREELKTDKALREEVLATALMIKHMKQQKIEQEKAILEEVKSSKDNREEVVIRPAEGIKVAERDADIPDIASHSATSKPWSRWYYWASSIAAVLIVGLFAVKPLYFNYKSNQMISQNYAKWSPSVDGTGSAKGTTRGEVQAGEDVIAELSELFDNVGQGKDMKMTTYRLEKALKESETDYEYYQYTSDIAWYLALAYIQENQFGKARKALAEIIESEDPDYSEQAEKLYKEIENMYFM